MSDTFDPTNTRTKARQLNVRTEPSEREGFREAARLSGLTLSAWVRMVLREAAERRLVNAGRKVPWR